MKLRVFVGVATFFFLVFGVFSVEYALAEKWQFTRTLQFGARGPDVFALQKFLNENPKTRVAEYGAGSIGKETNYFGRATEKAVIAFQKLKSGEADFSLENGRVGAITLAALNKQLAFSTPTKDIPRLPTGDTPLKGGIVNSPLEGSTPPIGGGRDVSEKAGGDGKTPHPNSRNLDQFLGIVKQVGGTQGYAQDKLETLTKEISSFALSTTTDFFAQFAKETNGSSRPISLESPFQSRITALLKKLTGVIVRRVDALAPSFGGMVLYVFPCTCSGNWLVGMVPLSVPPISLITHYPGSQAFMNFNAPFTLFMLGIYIPQGAPCLFYVGLACTVIPSQAQTTPVLGSS